MATQNWREISRQFYLLGIANDGQMVYTFYVIYNVFNNLMYEVWGVRNKQIERIVKLGVWSALAVMLTMLVHLPIFPAVSFLEYDPGDIPILMASFAFGPWWGLLVTVVVSVIQGLTVSASSGIIGILMHIAATGTGVVISGAFYRRRKSKRNAFIASILYVLSFVVIMPILNYFVTPLFLMSEALPYRQAQDIVMSMMWWILAFNLVKPLINAVFTFLLYKPVSRYVLKVPLDEERGDRKSYVWIDIATFGIYFVVVALIHLLRYLVMPDAIIGSSFTIDNAIMIAIYVILLVLALIADGKWRAARIRKDEQDQLKHAETEIPE